MTGLSQETLLALSGDSFPVALEVRCMLVSNVEASAEVRHAMVLRKTSLSWRTAPKAGHAGTKEPVVWVGLQIKLVTPLRKLICLICWLRLDRQRTLFWGWCQLSKCLSHISSFIYLFHICMCVSIPWHTFRSQRTTWSDQFSFPEGLT